MWATRTILDTRPAVTPSPVLALAWCIVDAPSVGLASFSPHIEK